MIADLPGTTVSKVARELAVLRGRAGAAALGRVLTLVIVTESGLEDHAIGAAEAVSREHPCRIIALAAGPREDRTRLDAQIRAGGDTGASEVIVLTGHGELAAETESLAAALLLPDAPIVAWWPHRAPGNPARTPLGRIAHRRITDSANAPDPRRALERLRRAYTPGDTDLAWTRLTNWRIHLAAALDHGTSPVTAAAVHGGSDSPSTILLASWLHLALGAPVAVVADPPGAGIRGVSLSRASGDIRLLRPGNAVAELTQPGQPAQRISLPRRTLQDCLAEELRSLAPEEIFADTLRTLATPQAEHPQGPKTPSGSTGPRPNHDQPTLVPV